MKGSLELDVAVYLYIPHSQTDVILFKAFTAIRKKTNVTLFHYSLALEIQTYNKGTVNMHRMTSLTWFIERLH